MSAQSVFHKGQRYMYISAHLLIELFRRVVTERCRSGALQSRK